MSLALLFHYLLLNMFRMLIHPSSGACDLFDALLHGLYCSGSLYVGVTLWFGWGGVVSVCRLKHQHTSYQNNTTHEITHQISRKLLRMDVLTSETCWAVNNEIIKQATSSWSLFIQLSCVKYELSLTIYKLHENASRYCNGRKISIDLLRNIKMHLIFVWSCIIDTIM